MRPRHVYRPPRNNRVFSTVFVLLGGALFTLMVFYVIPLMQKLDQSKRDESPDLLPPVVATPPPDFVPPPEEIPEEAPPEPDEPVETPPDTTPLDIVPIDIPQGISQRVAFKIGTGVLAGAAQGFDSGDGVDSDPVVSRKSSPMISPAITKQVAKRGEVRCQVWGMVDETGRVVEAGIERSSGIAALDRVCVQAYQKFRFKPAVRSGRKARARVKYTFPFKMNR